MAVSVVCYIFNCIAHHDATNFSNTITRGIGVESGMWRKTRVHYVYVLQNFSITIIIFNYYFSFFVGLFRSVVHSSWNGPSICFLFNVQYCDGFDLE